MKRMTVALLLAVLPVVASTLVVTGIALAMLPPPTITLVTPAPGAIIQQNDSALAGTCTLDANRGYGFRVAYDWDNPLVKQKGAFTAFGGSYRLVVQHGANTPALDVTVTTSSYTDTECNAFVIGNNLNGWQWRVTAVKGGKVVADSGPRSFSFGPCVLASTAPCSAPF